MHAINVHFAVVFLYKRFFNAALSKAQAFYLRPGERKTSFPGFLYKIIVICFFIVRDQFLC